MPAAEVDLLFYQIAVFLAQPQGAMSLARLTTMGRTNTIQANTQRFVQAGEKLANGATGARGEAIANMMLKNQGRFEEFQVLKNASNNGCDIIAKTHEGKWIFYEVKTSTTGTAPPLRGLQRSGAELFARIRLNEIIGRTGNFKNVSPETVQNARRVLAAIENERVEGYIYEITNLGQKTQSVNIVPWVPK